jgi:acetyl-CoA carboxylase biotin carboxyl carrier protein
VSGDDEVLRRIVDAFERSDWAEIDVRAGPLRIHLSSRSDPSTHVDVDPPPSAEQPVSVPERTETPAVAPVRPAAELPAGTHLVVSPSPGIFWRSPQPGAPPFADTGDHVEAESTVCIVEVMKLMNHVKAAVAGTVITVFPGDGVGVEQGEALFAVAPD